MSSATINMTTGVKGSDVYATTGSPLLDLSVMLNRGLDREVIRSAVTRIVASGDATAVEDLFVLAFQTRDIRGGKGERDLFKHFYSALNDELSSVTRSTVDLVPEYGCWRDLFALADAQLMEEVLKVTRVQLVADEAALQAATAAGTQPKLSLLAKWLPKEHSNKDSVKAQSKTFARALCPESKTPDADYRKRVAKLNTALKTVEIAMCDKRFKDIDPKSVPGRALQKYRAAFLNQAVKGEHGRKTPLTLEDRIACEQRFREHFAAAAAGKATVKGANTVFPHELVSRVLRGEGSSLDEHNAIQAQWNSIRDGVKATGGLNRCLAMCDFSGSMSGTPMDVSMALGCLISECNKGGAFEDYILTFDSTPTLHKFASAGIVERVNEVRHLAQGLSTDFQAAYNLVLKHLVDNAVPVGQEPKDLIVLTDMGWDQACGFGQHMSSYPGRSNHSAVKTKPQETHIAIARRAFLKAGELLFGEGNGWQAPRIVIWNLRAEYADFHATAQEEGVVQVAGWSPSLLRVLATRGVDALTPDAMLRAQLEDPRYDAVRQRVKPQLVAALSSRSTLRSDLARLRSVVY